MKNKKDKKVSYYDEISKEDIKQLEELLEEITSEAKKVVNDYAENPSDMSGSVIQVHQNSPFLKD
jgi:F0F1-type ATP synthase delta subunit